MSARPFAPVWITLPGRGSRRIENAFEAMEYLMDDWPKRGKAWRRAVGTCRDALDGVTPSYAARRAFLAAVQDAMGATNTTPYHFPSEQIKAEDRALQ